MAEESIPVPPASSSSSSPSAPSSEPVPGSAFAGWAALQKAVNVTVPAELAAAERLRQATLRLLGG